MSLRLRLENGLPYCEAVIHYRGQQVRLVSVLVDTGSRGSVFSADQLLNVGLSAEPGDPMHRIRGVGGVEFVYGRTIDRLEVAPLVVSHFQIEVGALDYGFALDGIIGTDFLLQTQAVIDFDRLEIDRVR
jgi:hypothetical protein